MLGFGYLTGKCNYVNTILAVLKIMFLSTGSFSNIDTLGPEKVFFFTMETVTDFLYMFNIEASRMSVKLGLFFIFLGLLYW